MQIMIYWDKMPSLLNTRLYHLLLIRVHILLTSDPFIPHLQTLVEVFQIVLISTIPGMVHQYIVRCQLLILFLPWISIIIVGSSIHLPSPPPVVEWEVVNNLRLHPSHKDLGGLVLIYQDQALLCIPSLSVTGML